VLKLPAQEQIGIPLFTEECVMLVLSRKARQVVLIGDDVWITVLEIKRGVVKLGIEAPRDVSVMRSELLQLQPSRGVDDPTHEAA
jgi:carbon storage regulator